MEKFGAEKYRKIAACLKMKSQGDPASLSKAKLRRIIILTIKNTKKPVGVIGFEPTASSSRTKRATGLRYTPN
jgi:hypothetical protein